MVLARGSVSRDLERSRGRGRAWGGDAAPFL